MASPVKIAIVGAGARGRGYANYTKAFPDKAQIVAVADPNDHYRELVGNTYNIPAEKRFKSWEEFVKEPKMADAVIIGTQDNMHEGPAIACAKLKYHILLEKPMAPTPEACKRIVAAAKEAGVIFAVCHVLRYTAFTVKLKELLDAGTSGDIASVQHLEPVGYWHQAHSFVRGNWRNEAESSFMLLAKCCHDLDWLRGIIGKRCLQVQSFGSLKHFKASEKPAGAADRCVNCPAEIESRCPYSALKIYFRDRFDKGIKHWPVNVLTPTVTEENLMDALKNGPYGRCVYSCDNDVVDNQVVNMLFEDGVTCSMTMTAFNNSCGRRTRIFGTKGYIDADSNIIKIFHYASDSWTEIDTGVLNDGGILSGHGGGDGGLMSSFVRAVAENNPAFVKTGCDESLESHLMVFAAEKSRRNGTVEVVE